MVFTSTLLFLYSILQLELEYGTFQERNRGGHMCLAHSICLLADTLLLMLGIVIKDTAEANMI